MTKTQGNEQVTDTGASLSDILKTLSGIAASSGQQNSEFAVGFCNFENTKFYSDYSRLLTAVGELLPEGTEVTGYVQWSRTAAISAYSNGAPNWTPPEVQPKDSTPENVINTAELVAIPASTTGNTGATSIKVFPRTGGWQLAVTRTASDAFEGAAPCIYDDMHYESGLGEFKTLTYRRIWQRQNTTSALRPIAFAFVGATAKNRQ